MMQETGKTRPPVPADKQAYWWLGRLDDVIQALNEAFVWQIDEPEICLRYKTLNDLLVILRADALSLLSDWLEETNQLESDADYPPLP